MQGACAVGFHFYAAQSGLKEPLVLAGENDLLGGGNGAGKAGGRFMLLKNYNGGFPDTFVLYRASSSAFAVHPFFVYTCRSSIKRN